MGASYCYDGTLGGLLTLLATLPAGGPLPENISTAPPVQQGLFSDTITVETDPELAEQYWQRLHRRLGPAGLAPVRSAFLANHPQKDMLIWRYLRLGMQEGRRVSGMLAHPQVSPLLKLAQQVNREAHRYLGFVRFQEVTGGFYYAALAPDHRVLLLIAPHFADRFRDQQWVIHDCRHGEGIVFDRHRRQWLLLPMETSAQPELTPQEEQFQQLWQSYFETLAIEERKNLKLQQSKVPLKTRSWLVEFGG
ncbi:TIGR03915 family putative DNA repair protein [Trichlorobacter ammonificans]|uniref:DNA metabolism protein n=1 Tax=Trichlorobacter ammonificans TaxID=2916410 RepID=A0ABM9DDR9_9BACT|nr:TIGR03915 family putative DNA repair protein [Trichlorobacter ammonificans]CAH2032531.1 putative DNA metabolism protein [Trichlorobacter ammonificans]